MPRIIALPENLPSRILFSFEVSVMSLPSDVNWNVQRESIHLREPLFWNSPPIPLVCSPLNGLELKKDQFSSDEREGNESGRPP